MAADLTDDAFEFLIQRARLDLSPTQKADLRAVYANIQDMAARVRKPRGRMAEPAHIYRFEDSTP